MDFHAEEKVQSESGVDLTLLRHNLHLTVTARWEQHFRALRMVEAFREAGQVRRSGPAKLLTAPPSQASSSSGTSSSGAAPATSPRLTCCGEPVQSPA